TLVTAAGVWLAYRTLKDSEGATRKYIAALNDLAGATRDNASAYQDAMTMLSAATRQNASATLLAHYQSRYEDAKHQGADRLRDRIAKLRKPAHESRNEAAKHLVSDFFDRFWNLQYEQWFSFRDGLVPPLVFRQWLLERHDEFY